MIQYRCRRNWSNRWFWFQSSIFVLGFHFWFWILCRWSDREGYKERVEYKIQCDSDSDSEQKKKCTRNLSPKDSVCYFDTESFVHEVQDNKESFFLRIFHSQVYKGVFHIHDSDFDSDSDSSESFVYGEQIESIKDFVESKQALRFWDFSLGFSFWS